MTHNENQKLIVENSNKLSPVIMSQTYRMSHTAPKSDIETILIAFKIAKRFLVTV